MSTPNVYILDGCRTPIGNLRGSLSPIRADDLATLPLIELLRRHPSITDAVDEVWLGCANQAGEDNRNIARMATLLSGLAVTTAAETVNRLCASGLAAAAAAYRAIRCGEGDLCIAGGVEHMTRAPMVLSKAAQSWGGNPEMYDSTFGWRFVNPRMAQLYGIDAMGVTAENVATQLHISRDAQDRFALASQMKATAAQLSGRLAQEIVAVKLPPLKKNAPETIFQHDEFVKSNSDLETLGRLRAAFQSDGSVTAGNSSGLNDGAAALLIGNGAAAEKHQIQPIARIMAAAASGIEPRIMGLGPVVAAQLALQRAHITFEDVDVIELNEAFAAQSLGVLQQWGIAADDSRVNPNGGAIALGHPLGMSGARILLSAALTLQAQQTRYALVTMCIGVGQGYAMVLERV